MVKLIGIDDAGRGPVIGPMVLAGVLIEENEEKEFLSYGVRDSKLLTSVNRKRIGENILERFDNYVVVSSPQEIDESSNLNYLEAIKSAMIINELTKEINEKVKVVIDCPSVNLEDWREDVWKLLKRQDIVELIVEHKADLNHLSVAAASIIAKERREAEIERIKIEFDADFGSGYPSDPKTKEFIKDNFANAEMKPIIRFSWKTVRRLVDGSGQKRLF